MGRCRMFQILFLKSTVSGTATPPRASRDIAFATSSAVDDATSPGVNDGNVKVVVALQ